MVHLIWAMRSDCAGLKSVSASSLPTPSLAAFNPSWRALEALSSAASFRRSSSPNAKTGSLELVSGSTSMR